MIFLDNASTTKVDYKILNDFINYEKEYYFNPGALYSVSVKISQKIEEARKEIVKLLKGDNLGYFIFTGSSTEANNIIINSSVSNNKNEEYIFSSLEHPSVYNIANKLMLEGRKIIFIPTLDNGKIDEKELYSKINSNTKFVSIINVSNETGEINDINKIAKNIKAINPKTLIHSDGVQALGKIPVDCSLVDFYTISSHKIHGLKGIAGFYCKKLKTLKPLILGGGQEFGIRSGTTNAPMIFSLLDTVKLAIENQEDNFKYVKELRNYLVEKLSTIDFLKINSSDSASPYIISLSVIGLNAETILNALSLKQIYIGLGSACSAKKSGNRVLESMHKSKAEIHGNIRISLSKYTTKEELNVFFNEFKDIIFELKDKLS